MSDEEFLTFQMSLAISLNEHSLNLDDLETKYQNQLATGSLDLNLGSKLAEHVMSLTKDDLINSSILEKYSKVFSISKK